MGLKLTKNNHLDSSFQTFRHQDWFLIHEQDITQNLINGQYITLKNKYTAQCIDRYQVFFQTEEQYNLYYSNYLQRIKQDYIVNTLHYEPSISKQFCTTAYQARIYIEHIPVRLSDISDIPFAQSLYMLDCMIKGFQKLYRKIGYFELFEEQVCIDQAGNLKVWINTDLSKNEPIGFRDNVHNIFQERAICKEVLYMISKNTEDNSDDDNIFPPLLNFIEIQCRVPPNFKELKFILDKFIAMHNIDVPSYCQSVVNIFQEQYDAEIFPLAPNPCFNSEADKNGYPIQIISDRYSVDKENSDRSKKLSLKSKQLVDRNSSRSCLKKLSNSSSSHYYAKNHDETKSRSSQNDMNSDHSYSSYQINLNGHSPNHFTKETMPLRDLTTNQRVSSHLSFNNISQEQFSDKIMKRNLTQNKLSNQNTVRHPHPSESSHINHIKFTYENPTSRTPNKLISFAQEQENINHISDQQNRRCKRPIPKQNRDLCAFPKSKPAFTLSIIEEEEIDPQILADLAEMSKTGEL